MLLINNKYKLCIQYPQKNFEQPNMGRDESLLFITFSRTTYLDYIIFELLLSFI